MSPPFPSLWTPLCGAALLLWCAALMSCAAPASQAGTGEPVAETSPEVIAPGPGIPVTGHYEVTLRPELERLEVLARFPDPPDTLVLAVPSVWVDGKARSNHIDGLQARCAGQELALEALGGGRLGIERGACQEPIEVSYGVRAGRVPARAIHGVRIQSQRGALIYGQGAWVVPVFKGAGALSVEVLAPARWTTVSTWSLFGTQVEGRRARRWRFVAHDPGHMLDSVLVAGDLRIYEEELSDGRRMQVALGGPLPMEDQALVSAAARLASVQRAYLPSGWRWPRGTDALSVIVLGDERGQARDGAGRRGGVVLEVGAGLERRSLLELLSHELFHTLNGHLLIHRPEAQFSTLWFKEGLTTYVGLVSVVRAGLATKDWWRSRMEELVGHYYRNPLALKLLASAVQDRYWTSQAARRLPYDKGALLAMLIDAHAPRSPQGHWGHERLVRRLMSDMAAAGLAYGPADILEALRQEGFVDVETFWNRFVEGAEPLPLAQGLQKLGLSMVKRSEAVPYFGLTLGQDAHGAHVVMDVDPQGPAAKAGLLRGDRLTHHPTVPWKTPGSSARLQVSRARGPLDIVIHSEPGQQTVYRLIPNDMAPAFEPLLAPK